MISSSVFIALGIMIAAGIILPLTVSIWWLKTRHERIATLLLGAATFFVFALVLESIVHNIVFTIFPSLIDNTIAYMIYGAFMAGLFEETGRYLTMRFLLKKFNNRETSISFGIGHGGFEALFILAYSGVQNIAYATLINQGKLQMIIDEAAKAGADTSAIESLPEQFASFNTATIGLAIFERCGAMLFHVAMSILVFYAVKKARPAFYLLAILLHALLDSPAALYQKGIITNQLVLELIIAAFVVTVFVIIYKTVYSKYTPNEEVTEIA